MKRKDSQPTMIMFAAVLCLLTAFSFFSCRNPAAGIQGAEVSFYLAGGTPEIEPRIIPRGTLLEPVETPVRAGHRFAGWYKDADFTQPWDFDNYVVYGNITLFARWVRAGGGGGGGGGGAGTPGSGQHSITVLVERSLPASTPAFTLPNPAPTATVSATPNLAAHGTPVTFSAVPGIWYIFDGWEVLSGGVTIYTSAANPATFTMPAANVTVTANFTSRVIPRNHHPVNQSPPFVPPWLTLPPGLTTFISGYNLNGSGGALIIPEYIVCTIGGGTYRVVGIGWNAFLPASVPPGGYNHGGLLTNVYIPNSIIYIGPAAFAHNNLTSVTIPDSVIYLGNWAFRNNNLEKVSIGNSVTSIGNLAFIDNDITSVTIGNSVTSIGIDAFRNNSLSNVIIPNSVITIHPSAFMNNNLTSVTIGNSVISIETSAFRDNNLTSVVIPNSVTNIGVEAFRNNNLTSVTIGNSVTSIGISAFMDNELTSVIIPDSVTAIQPSTFMNNNLTSVTIGNSVANISTSAFRNNNLTSVVIPNSVTNIGVEAFRNNNLTSVVIPNSVTNIGIAAFADNNLTSVTIGSGVTLGPGAIGFGFEAAYGIHGAGTFTRPNATSWVWTHTP